MTTTTHTLRRTGDAPLAFTGQLLRAATTRLPKTPRENRWHELTVYTVDGGGYVLSVEYHTCWQGEDSHSFAVFCRPPRDVVAALREYDPCEYVHGYPPGEAYAERQAALLVALRSGWEGAVSRILDSPEFASGPDEGEIRLREARDQRMYLTLMEIGLRGTSFTEAEAALLADANNGHGEFALRAKDEDEWRIWPCNTEDEVRLNRLDVKHGVDWPALAAKIQALGPLETAAVSHALAVFWEHDSPTGPLLREVGLVRD
jgi:hypothetical protein